MNKSDKQKSVRARMRKNPLKLRPLASNMTQVETDDGITVLFSYQTPVAAFVPGKGICKTDKKWSATTSRHISKWIAMTAPSATVTVKPQEWFDTLVAANRSNPRKRRKAKVSARIVYDPIQRAHVTEVTVGKKKIRGAALKSVQARKARSSAHFKKWFTANPTLHARPHVHGRRARALAGAVVAGLQKATAGKHVCVQINGRTVMQSKDTPEFRELAKRYAKTLMRKHRGAEIKVIAY